MKAIVFTILMVLGMSSSLSVAGQITDEEQARDSFSQNIQHIYNPSIR